MGVMNMSSWLFGMVQVPLITALLHPALAPGFYAAQRITQMINAATLQVAVPQMPFFTRDVAQGAYCSAAKRMQRIIGGVTIAAGLIYGLLWVGGPIIAGWWLGPGKFVSRGVFGIMALDNTIGICSVIWAQFVLAAGRNCFMLSTVAAGAINLLVCVLLAPHWGLAGIASGTVIAGGLTNYWFAPREGIRVLRRLRQGAAP
jgi:O-antigen/teichoic acid export membrane protein